jgi:hypothetical protein
MARLRLLGLLLVFTAACGNITRKNDSDGGIDGPPIDAPPDASPAALEIDMTTFDFGSVTEGTSGSMKTFTVKNKGALPTGALQAATLSGAAASSFGIISDTCHTNTLAPNATCTIAIQFSPPVAGSLAATLTVTANPGGTVTSDLTGIAVTNANLAIVPNSWDFGSTLKAGSSATKTFTLMNSGGTATGAVTISPMGTDAGQFQVTTTTCGATLGAGASCTFDGKFVPTSRGMKGATFTAQAVGAGQTSTSIMGLGQEQYTLTVNKTGSSGLGTVATSPNTEINCDAANTDCTQVYTVGVTPPTITLAATAATGSRFGAFSNACTTAPCSVVMDQDRTVTATFIKTYVLTIGNKTQTGAGVGTVTSTSNPTQTTQMNCPTANAPCAVAFDTGAVVTLTASVTGQNRFSGWSNICSGAPNNPVCQVTMSADTGGLAGFLQAFTVNVALTGTGSGTVNATGIACGSDCTEDYAYGTTVTFTAVPTQPDALFGGWSGACSGSSLTCTVNITAAANVSAKFDRILRASWDPAFSGPGLDYTNGNLSVAMPATTTTTRNVRSTVGKSSGKWYWEVTATAGTATTNAGGIGITEAVTQNSVSYFGSTGAAMSFGYGPANSQWYSSFSAPTTVAGAPPANSAIAANIVYMFALDMDNKKLWIGQNGSWYNSGNPANGTNPVMTNLTGTVFPGITFYGQSGNAFTANFGATTFSHAVPIGFTPGLYATPAYWDTAFAPSGSLTFSNNNLSVAGNTATAVKNARTTVGKTSGRWYWEIKADNGTAGANQGGLGLMDANHPNNTYIGQSPSGMSFGYSTANLVWYTNWTGVTVSPTAPTTAYAIATGNVYMFALDLSAGKLYVGLNGSWAGGGDPVAGTNPVLSVLPTTIPVFPGITFYGGSLNTFTANFTNPGNYSYPRPSGYAPLGD